MKQNETEKRWNKKQQEVIRILGDPLDHRPQYQIAVDIGIAEETISRWKQDTEFIKEVNKEFSKNTKGARPNIYKALIREALKEKGFRDRKLYFELTGEYEDRKKLAGEEKLPIRIVSLPEIYNPELEEGTKTIREYLEKLKPEGREQIFELLEEVAKTRKEQQGKMSEILKENIRDRYRERGQSGSEAEAKEIGKLEADLDKMNTFFFAYIDTFQCQTIDEILDSMKQMIEEEGKKP